MVPVCHRLQQELEEHILVRTGHRIRELSIELRPERIVLRGRTRTYHIKQLAQHGVRDLLPTIGLENAIVVDNN
jgi:hypothetical protein